MHKVYFKHMGLPIADMFAEIKIDHERQFVAIRVDHFDSALLIDAAHYVERHFAPVRLVDDASHATWGPAAIPNRYKLFLNFDDYKCEAYVVQKVRLGSVGPEFTISLGERLVIDE